jgi:hypothetical protein
MSGRLLSVWGTVLTGTLALCAMAGTLLVGSGPALGFTSTPTASGFGFEKFDGLSLGAGGELDMQAGSHPQELSFTFALNTVKGANEEVLDSAGGELRDLKLILPAGLIVNADAVPRCTRRALDEGTCAPKQQLEEKEHGIDQVGEVTLETVSGGVLSEEASPIYNMDPPGSAAAELAFKVGGTGVEHIGGADVLTYMSLRTGALTPGEGGIDLDILDLPPKGIVGGRITLFGVTSSGAPFLTLPTVCGEPIAFAASANTWQNEEAFAGTSFLSHETVAGGGEPTGIGGCNMVAFAPTVSTSVETKDADTASGLTVDVKSPPEGLLAPNDLSPSDIQSASVLLPEGLVLNPDRAEGLVSCLPAQSGLGTEGPPSCPGTSQVGTVQISTPILPNTLEGAVYALPSSPPEIELLLSGSADGVNMKLRGLVELNESTGQVTLSFPQAPLLPINQLRISLSGALVTPRTCGVYTAGSDLKPWVEPAVLDALETSSIEIAHGPEGGACAFPPRFTPALTAGTSNDGAGGFASLSILLARPDGQQRISSLQVKAPPGLLAMLGSVPLCDEPQAAQGVCPAASEVGHAVLGAGPGGYPLFLPGPGQPPIPIYLTGPYEGAPYGLAIVVPFIAGPYDLGTRVLRARIEMNPHTAQLTIATDPLPTILDGVPLDLRTLYAILDRPAFVFNPTDCSASSFQGTASSVEGATVPISTPFQVGSCQSLQFTPTLQLSTSAKISKQKGASLRTKIAYPPSREGAVLESRQSNLESVKLQLPKQLPSRLATFRQACPANVFESDPASCPAAALAGQASAITPVLGVPLSGPAYLVSHAGEAHPAVIVVLQGGGLEIDLDATTTIGKNEVTTVTFAALPDFPISSFELTLPESSHSALAANGSLCKGALTVPTELVAHNGAVIDQATKLTVNGCPKTAAHPKTKIKGRAKK